jgi:peptidyl-prolyl cis-trans isomerase C
MRITIIALSLAVLALGPTGCRGKSDTVAKINGVSISRAQFDSYLRFKRLSPKDAQARDRALDDYLQRKALASAIEKQKTLDKGLIDAELEQFRNEMLISRYFERFLDSKVNDQAVKNYYESHKKEFQDQKIHVAHILVRLNPAMGETERKAKLTAIQDAYAKLQAGEDFAKLATEVSEDRVSSKRGGDLGWLRQGSVDPKFSQKAFSMKPGEVSEPFETPFGYHILKVVEGKKTVTQPFQAVAGDIRYRLRNEAKQAELERLKAKIKIEKLASSAGGKRDAASMTSVRKGAKRPPTKK